MNIVEMLPEIALDVPPQAKYFLLQRLEEYNVQINIEAEVIEFLEGGVVVSRNGGISRLEGFDTIVLALGTVSVNVLKGQLTGKITGTLRHR